MLHEYRGAVSGAGEDLSAGDAVVGQDVAVFCRDVVRLNGVAQLCDVLLLRQKELMECAWEHWEQGATRWINDQLHRCSIVPVYSLSRYYYLHAVPAGLGEIKLENDQDPVGQ